MKDALSGAGVGAVGGLIYGLSQSIFGTGIWGGLAGIVIAGSVLKGTAGEIVATVLGFEIGKNLLVSGSAVNTAIKSFIPV